MDLLRLYPGAHNTVYNLITTNEYSTVRDAVPGTHVYPVVLLYINVLVCNDYNEITRYTRYCTVPYDYCIRLCTKMFEWRCVYVNVRILIPSITVYTGTRGEGTRTW